MTRNPLRSPARSCAPGSTRTAKRSRPPSHRSSAKSTQRGPCNPLSDASIAGRTVHVVVPGQNPIRVVAAVEQEDYRLGRHTLTTVERNAGGHPQRLASLCIRVRLAGAERRQQYLGRLLILRRGGALHK